MFDHDRFCYEVRSRIAADRARVAVRSGVQANYQVAWTYPGELSSDQPVKIEVL
jgi:hypothetical protein